MALFAENDFFIVRSFTLSDIDDFCLVVMDPQCMKYCPTGRLNRHQAESLFMLIIKQKTEDGAVLFAIEDKLNQHVVGFVGLQECSVENDIGLSFVFRLLPDFLTSTHIPCLFEQLIQNMFSLFQFTSMQAIVAKNNLVTMTILESLSFKKMKTIECRGIESLLYQYP